MNLRRNRSGDFVLFSIFIDLVYFYIFIIMFPHYSYSQILFEKSIMMDVEEATLAVGQLLQELDRPASLMTMISRPLGRSDIDCPLHLCDHVEGVILVPDRTRLFVSCLRKRQFCGLCPRGTVAQLRDHTFRCVLNADSWTNDTQSCAILRLCKFDFRQRLRISTNMDLERFVLCSKRKSFCGFCPPDIAKFNTTTLNCDAMFPETQVECKKQTTEIIPDPLSQCSPLIYICLPGKRMGNVVRCPNAKMRHNRHYMTCDLPEHVPECGGILQPAANLTSIDLEHSFNATEYAQLSRNTGQYCMYNCVQRHRLPLQVCFRQCSA